MSQLHDPQAVAAATGCDTQAVAATLPLILDALQEQGILTTPAAIGALATAAVECGFRPLEEAGTLTPASRRLAYLNRTAYGRVDAETGQRYFGRGLIQLTWKRNYADYGRRLGLDLLHHPELALTPTNAARILAAYLKQTGAAAACDAGRWRDARILVNGLNKQTGQPNGWERFAGCVERLRTLR